QPQVVLPLDGQVVGVHQGQAVERVPLPPEFGQGVRLRRPRPILVPFVRRGREPVARPDQLVPPAAGPERVECEADQLVPGIGRTPRPGRTVPGRSTRRRTGSTGPSPSRRGRTRPGPARPPAPTSAARPGGSPRTIAGTLRPGPARRRGGISRIRRAGRGRAA